MVSGVSNAAPAQPVAQPTGKAAQKPAQSKHPADSGTDSVQLSGAAQALLAARQEARETPAQTAREANQGDRQAKNLLAKEAAQKQTTK